MACCGAQGGVGQRQPAGDRGAAGEAALHLLADVDLLGADHGAAVLLPGRYPIALGRPDTTRSDQAAYRPRSARL